MWNVVYYLAYAGMASALGFGVLYIVDKKKARDITQKISWNAVKVYHKVNLEVENVKRWYGSINKKEKRNSDDDVSDNDFDTNEIETESKNSITFIGYKISDDTTYTTKEIENNEYIQENEFDLMFLKKTQDNDIFYRRIEDKSTDIYITEFEKFNKPFLQIELTEDIESVERKSIHKYLDQFYIKGNKVLDNKFLKWYMLYFYSNELSDNYTLHIIDTDINMLTINNNEYIKLKDNGEKEKTYNVVKNEN